MPLGLVSTQAPLISHSTCYTNLLFQKATTVMVLDLLYSIMLPLATHIITSTYSTFIMLFIFKIWLLNKQIYCFYMYLLETHTLLSSIFRTLSQCCLMVSLGHVLMLAKQSVCFVCPITVYVSP